MAAPAATQGKQEFLRVLQGRAAARSKAVASLGKELLAYRDARAALSGPALADWTVRYEQSLQQLVAHAVDSVNDVFDSGSWPVVMSAMAAQPAQEKAEDVVSRLRSVVVRDFGDAFGAAVDALSGVVAGSTIATASSPAGVTVTLSRESRQLITFGLSARPATGDAARASSSRLLAGRPSLVIGRRYAPDRNVRNGNVDFYGAFLGACSWLLANARREVRAAEQYGRVRVRGEVPVLIALAVWAIIAAVAWGAAGIACAVDSQSSACNTLEQIAAFISIFGFFVVIGIGTAAVGGGPAVGGVTFNFND
jgi:hypothetical protein